MVRYHLGIVALSLSMLVGGSAAAPPSGTDKDAQALAAKIDELVAARWRARGVVPAAPADDAEFARRVYLDLIGRIPTIVEIRDFLDRPEPDKRWLLVQDLLRSEDHYSHFAAVWRAILFANITNQQTPFLVPNFESYLRTRIKENTSYDKLVREILTVQPFNGAGASVFYQANENKIENAAAATSRLFLGVKLECAQCHNHPFAKWSREQFWEYACFFTDVPQGGRGVTAPAKPAQLTIPGTATVVKAKFLDGKMPMFKDNAAPRTTLADWMTTADNPYFARTAVNRLWEYFFGIGLIEPVDEFSDDNPPSHPELLDELTRQFTAHHFDMTFLIRAILASKTYQRTSALSHPSQNEPRLFARMAVRGMSPEQLFDSLAEATALDNNERGTIDPRFRGFNPDSPRAQFLARFPNQDRRTEAQTSILQALYIMNGKLTVDATSLMHNKNLKTISETQPVQYAKRVQELYLITLSRRPRPEETARLVKYIESGGPTKDQGKALADVFWALLNSTEFYFNH